MRGMELAVLEARRALEEGEIPVGAVLMRGDEVIWADHNRREQLRDPTAHAEMLALREAARALGNDRLPECTLYVTLEPCAMCAGAIQHARLARVVFAAPNEKTGAVGSVLDLFAPQVGLNHHTAITRDVLRSESAQLLAEFFRARR